MTPGAASPELVDRLARACPVCGGTSARFLRHQRFVLPPNHPLHAGYDVVSCQTCGFVFAETAAIQADYDRFYAEFSKYDNIATSTGGGGTPEDRVRLQRAAGQVAAFEADRSAPLLDVGCATGGLLHALDENGFTRLRGLDPSPASRVQARELFGIDVVVGSLLAPPDLGQFRGVLISHVMEHILDLPLAVSRLAGFVEPGGWLFVEVPDAAHYSEHLVAPFQDFNAEHINHFGLVDLDRLLAPFGFIPAEAGHTTCDSAPNTPYPCLWGFWRRNAPEGPRLEIERDRTMELAMREYIARSQAMLDGYNAELQKVLDRGPGVIVWGAGQLTLRLLAETCLGRANIRFFVDGNPMQQGKRLLGVPILSPAEIAGHDEPIVIASTIHQAGIARRIREELGLTNELVKLRPDDS